MSRSSDMLRVLRFLANQDCKVQCKDICMSLDLHPRKAQFILRELIDHGFVIRDGGMPCGYKFNQDFRSE